METKEQILQLLTESEKLLFDAWKKLSEAESLIRKTVVINQDKTNALSCKDICYQLFRQFEPNIYEEKELISYNDLVDYELAPRGELSCLKLKYEIACNKRAHTTGWKYPKVKPEEIKKEENV